MIQKIFVFLALLLLPLATPSSINAQSTVDWNNYTTTSGKKCVENGDIATIQGLECLFYNVLQVIVYIAGLAFIFMFLSGSFQYLTSAGDPKKTAAAGSTLTMAILGLAGIILSYLILRLIQNFTGINVLEFAIPG